jgi:hypothetical protein
MSISTFWVPLDPFQCSFSLQYETDAYDYILCFMLKLFKVYLNTQQRIILTLNGT